MRKRPVETATPDGSERAARRKPPQRGSSGLLPRGEAHVVCHTRAIDTPLALARGGKNPSGPTRPRHGARSGLAAPHDTRFRPCAHEPYAARTAVRNPLRKSRKPSPQRSPGCPGASFPGASVADPGRRCSAVPHWPDERHRSCARDTISWDDRPKRAAPQQTPPHLASNTACPSQNDATEAKA